MRWSARPSSKAICAVDQPAPLPALQAATDGRAGITIDHLLRQTTGQAIVQNNSGFDDNARILLLEADKAGASAAMPMAPGRQPGTLWNYTDANFLMLSRVLRDSVGASPADWQAWAQRSLLAPLGMRHTVLTLDATGTPLGASFFMASGRDWARLGQLYLDDGMAAGQRILPPGWARHAATPTLATGYGAGWWTNALGGQLVPAWGVPWGLANAPRDAFFARGLMGQYVVVVPSRGVVIVRLGSSHIAGDGIRVMDELVGDVLAALPGAAAVGLASPSGDGPAAATEPAPGSAARPGPAPA